MTKSTITRERAQQIFLGNGPEPSASEERELARMALAALDTEPAGEFYEDGPLNWYQISDGDRVPAHRRIPLYRHAQPAPVVVPNGLRLALSNAGIAAPESDEMLAATCEKHIQALVAWVRNRKPFQSAPVVPEEANPDSIEILASARRRDHAVFQWDEDQRNAAADSWNACRAAMLAAAPQPQNAPQNIPEIIPSGLVEAVNKLLNNDGSRGCYDAIECNAARVKIELWLAQRQRWEGQRKTNLFAGNSSLIPEGWQVEAEKLAEMHGMSFVLFRHGEAPQCADPTKVVISFTDKGLGHDTLPAAHQEVKP